MNAPDNRRNRRNRLRSQFARPEAQPSAGEPAPDAYRRDGNSLAWEWEVDDAPPRPTQSPPDDDQRLLTAPLRGPMGAARVESVRRALTLAVDQFGNDGTLPAAPLLRDSLLILEAGYELDAAQHTLLARTALARGRGQLTALHHLDDPERAATLLHEALAAGSFDINALLRLLRYDMGSADWLPFLRQELRAALSSPLPAVAERAAHHLAVLDAAAAGETPVVVHTLSETPPDHRPLRLLIAGILFLALFAIWYLRVRPPSLGDVVRVPGGLYTVTNEAGGAQSAEIAPFAMDRTEVTNEQYRACYSAGACNWPAQRSSVTRDTYFVDPLYNRHPVIWVDWPAAGAYCRWRGMRLPTAAEWEIAASWAPATERSYLWPWGDRFVPEFAVTARSHEDSAEVGSRSPNGDSPLGVADMGGNVAEWTATTPSDRPQMAFVKGGSFLSTEADALRAHAMVPLLTTAAAPDIGFRCASSR